MWRKSAIVTCDVLGSVVFELAACVVQFNCDLKIECGVEREWGWGAVVGGRRVGGGESPG